MSTSTSTVDRDHPKGTPRIVVAVAHPTMRRYLCDLIEQNCRCWLATSSPEAKVLDAALANLAPDILVVDDLACFGDYQRWTAVPTDRVIVIGPEPDNSYRAAAMDAGVGAWVSRDQVDTELVLQLERMLASYGYEPRRNRSPQI